MPLERHDAGRHATADLMRVPGEARRRSEEACRAPLGAVHRPIHSMQLNSRPGQADEDAITPSVRAEEVDEADVRLAACRITPSGLSCSAMAVSYISGK